jgi:hypothetical protein
MRRALNKVVIIKTIIALMGEGVINNKLKVNSAISGDNSSIAPKAIAYFATLTTILAP